LTSQPEVISVFLRETLDHLGELVGETTTEDILNNIFGKFCIGK
jgi:tRNA modification GTPase